VTQQGYPDFEHIVIDGGSTDGTLDVLHKHRHLRWISEPDRGQSDAMNKGFELAKGNIITYLNADDYFLPFAFQSVSRAVAKGEEFIVGRVEVLRENGSKYINDPKVELSEMFRWWNPDAYCYNSAGYFYSRKIQEEVGLFNVHDHYTMDYEFLLKASQICRFAKIPAVLACFRLFPGTKTLKIANRECEIFQRFKSFLYMLEPDERAMVLSEWRNP
jgi:glycosyltransferase involved in cell wall biosynthesis